ncbi:PadR family transcriptional regulator [Micromonospora aurantiaca (nom. illeg.)]|uniref:PadR family transcriptional regulator n=1 Tax=Micromonospora aurantiaca (nom. illeg.) TaxID=47850 RepID=UPI0001DF6F0B|nr:PadR family transcriptional regulator [Micromonospora aurantiaca]ADL47653.1 transcriptional regulator PadR family protein [Micromonospora aurantiaca ATCC 27029]
MATPTPLREPTFLILTALAREPMHGYGIISDVAALSGGRLALRPGTLYGALDRLTDEGLVERDHEEVVEGRLRRYYRLTEAGRSVLTAETERLRRNVEAASQRLRIRPAGIPAAGGTSRAPVNLPGAIARPTLRPTGGLA